MAETSQQRGAAHSHEADHDSNVERPSKRARIALDGQAVPSTKSENSDDDWEEEVSIPAQKAEPRASDLYLDTVGLFNNLTISCAYTPCQRSIDKSLISISKRFAQSLRRISTSMAALYVENTSKAEVVILTRMPIPFTMTTMSSSTLRLQK
jgi:hypothetical protein